MGATNTRKNNTHSNTGRVGYIFANIFLTYIAGHLIVMVERKLGMLMDHDAFIRATLCMGISCLICIFASVWNTKQKLGIFLNVVVSTEVFLIALHMNDGMLRPILPMDLLLGVTTISIIFDSLVVKYDRGASKISAKYWFRQLFVIERFFAAALCPIILLVVGIQVAELPGKSVEAPEIVAVQSEKTEINDSDVVLPAESVKTVNYDPHPVYDDSYMLSNNLDRIKLIASSEEWDSLSLDQRQDTMVAIIECELRYLGIPFHVDIRFEDFPEEDANINGAYLPNQKVILINNDALKEHDNMKNLRTALHEVRHVYQICMCNIYVRLSDEEKALDCFYGVDQWCKDYENYDEKKADLSTYASMSVEIDARDYASKEAEVYLLEIEKHMGN